MHKLLDNWKTRAERVIAQEGSLTNSKRPSALTSYHPTHVVRGEKCYLYDSEGERWIDFIGGLGSNLLGYAHPKVLQKASEYAAKGPSLSMSSVWEVELAERLCNMTGYPKVRFFKTGTEACMAAIRILRSSKGVGMNLYSGGYHGWSDIFVSKTAPALGLPNIDGMPSQLEDCHCSIIEPIELNNSEIRKDWIKHLVKNYPVIFDEIITGFRVPEQFVYKWWNCKPDILVLGKAMANGYPISAVFMSNEMAEIEWFCSGTFCGELGSIGACQATLDEIEKLAVKDLFYYANRFMDNFNKITKDIDVKLEGYGTRGMLNNENPKTALLMQEMAKSKIILGKAFFYNYAHLQEGVETYVLNILNDCAQNIKNGKAKYEGELPKNSFKR